MEGILGGWHVPIISGSQDRKAVGLGQPGLPKERNRRFLCSWMASSYRTVVFNSIQHALQPGLGVGVGGTCAPLTNLPKNSRGRIFQVPLLLRNVVLAVVI